MLAVREIAHAFLLAEHPRDVQQFALDRVTPLLGAAFSLVMELAPDGSLLRPVAQHEWPSPHRQWIGALRVRVGDGPSGLAVAERRVVEVDDLFADPALASWHDVATELGFRSIIAAPLETSAGPIGAVAFYFADATSISDDQRALVRLVADQLAAATDKARQTDTLRRVNGALAEANAELESQAKAWSAAERARADIEGHVVDALLALTAADDSRPAEERMRGIHLLATVAQEYAAVIAPGAVVGSATDVDPSAPLRAAVARCRARAPMVPIEVDEPTVLLPTMRADEGRLTRALELVVGLGVCGAAVPGGAVRAGVRHERGFLALTVRWRGRAIFDEETMLGDTRADQPLPDPLRILRMRRDVLRWEARDPYAPAHRAVTAIDLPLARALTVRLGGDFRIGAPAADGEQEFVLVFPVDVERD